MYTEIYTDNLQKCPKKIKQQGKEGGTKEPTWNQSEQYHTVVLRLVSHNLNTAVKALKVLYGPFLNLN